MGWVLAKILRKKWKITFVATVDCHGFCSTFSGPKLQGLLFGWKYRRSRTRRLMESFTKTKQKFNGLISKTDCKVHHKWKKKKWLWVGISLLYSVQLYVINTNIFVMYKTSAGKCWGDKIGLYLFRYHEIFPLCKFIRFLEKVMKQNFIKR